jgi:hypothetical protein
LVVALLEVAINRIAVPMLRPAKGLPPAWHTYLDYAGLFLFYFAGTLAAFVIGAHIVRRFQITRGVLAHSPGAQAVDHLVGTDAIARHQCLFHGAGVGQRTTRPLRLAQPLRTVKESVPCPACSPSAT